MSTFLKQITPIFKGKALIPACLMAVFMLPLAAQCPINNFSGPFSSMSWNSTLDGGTINTSGLPGTLVISGNPATVNSPGAPADRFTDYCITIPIDGSISFTAAAVMNLMSGQFAFDEPSFLINGIETFIASGSSNILPATPFGPLNVICGDEFCFRVRSNRNSAYTILTITNFNFQATNPMLSADINGISVVTNNDGNDETATFSICSGTPSPNVTLGTFSASCPASGFIKVYQEIEFNGVTQSGSWCSGTAGAGCSAGASAFAGQTNTFTGSGTVTIRFRAFFDANDNDDLDMGECVSDWVVYNITVNDLPVLTAQRPEICPADNPFDLTSLESAITSATGTFEYSFNGAPVADPTQFTAANGDVVNVVFTDDNGCSNTTTITFTLLPAPAPTIGPFSGNPFNNVCVGDMARFLASPTAAGPPAVAKYDWSFSGTPTLSNHGQTANDGMTTTYRNRGAIYSAADVGVQTVNLTVTYANGCVVSAPQHTIMVLALPVLNPQSPEICIDANPYDLTSLESALSSSSGSYAYSFGGNPLIDPTQFTAADGDVVNVTFTDGNGCTNTTTITFTVNDLPVLTAQRPEICPADNPFDLTSLESAITSATGTFEYSFNGAPVADPTQFTAANGDVVNVVFTDDNGCSNTTTITFTILPAPAPTIGPFSGNPFNNVCVGDMARFLASPTAAGPPAVAKYDWSFSGTPTLSNHGQTANDGMTTTYRNRGAIYSAADVGVQTVNLTVTYANGCVVSAPQHTITVNANPVADITPSGSPVICPLTELQLNSNPSGGSGVYVTHSWYNAVDYLDDTEIQDPTFVSPLMGEYIIYYLVIDDKGCIGRDTITIVVDDQVAPKLICPDAVQMDADQDRCSAVVCFPVSATDNCDYVLPTEITGYTYLGSFNDHHYFHSNFNVSWEAANSAAASLGANLVSINSLAEQNFLNGLIPNGPTSQFWIGLRYSPSLGAFKWTSGEPVTYINWGPGQPGILDGDYVYHFDAITPALRGWYDSPAIFNRRFIIEFSGLPVQLVSGIPSGSIFPVGETTVTYSVTDQKENVSICEFIVEVSDKQVPEFTDCPEDIIVQLNRLECGRNVDFEVSAIDNCELDRIEPLVETLAGSYFEIGDHQLEFTAYDIYGNSSKCEFTISVRDFRHPSLGCMPFHLSLDEACQATLTPYNVLTGYQGEEGEINLGCLNCFEISVMAPNGNNLGATVDGTYLGKTLMYSIKNTKTDFSCWNTVLIEDKIKPTIECRNDTISCMTPLSTARLPIPSDNCHAKLVKLNEYHQKLDCDPDFIGRYIRTWIAVDDYGNESESCNDTVYLKRTDLTGLVFPDHQELSCSSGFAVDSKGFPYPAPKVTGVPTLNGQDLYPFEKSLICNGAITYNDQLILNTTCKKRIIRTWFITEWWCSTTVTYNMPFQIIDILDKEAPYIPQLADITVTTRTRSCDADVPLPQLNITDNCAEVKLVVINATLNGVPSGTVNGNGGLMRLSVGTHKVEYTAIDECGNTNKMHYYITVKDDTAPVAICDNLNVVSLNSNGYAQVSAIAADDGSFDECGPVTLQIQRMEDPCGNGHNVGWHDAVAFCCEDAHLTRAVIVLVTDMGGNTNMCMVDVQVQDKINPVITCPPHEIVDDCTFTFDPNNAGVAFGYATVFDNCPSTVDIREVLQDGRTNCGIGIVTRTFTALVNGTIHSTCVQTIEFKNIAPFNAYNPDHVTWPKDTLLTGSCSALDLLPESLGDLHGYPAITEDACDLVGLTYEDKEFYFANNNACFKILRTWTIIDWCQKGTDGKHLTWTWEQEIKVTDNTAPAITSPTADRMQCITDSSCEGGNMTGLIATATDCTPDSMLQWSYIIYNTNVNPQTIHKMGFGNDVSGYYPLGKYRVAFEVSDRCGNISTTGFNFEMRNCKKPTPVCKDGLSTTLSLMPDGNGGMTPQVMVEASFFNNKSYHPCGYPVAISFSADSLDRVRSFNCSHIDEPQRLEIWVTDINGNAEYCVTFLDVQDSLGLCGSGRIAVQGTVMTDSEVEVENVTVDINNGEGTPTITDVAGHYIFEDLPSGLSYTFTPKKDGDDKNGISTLDIVMIQRHILGIQKIVSPYRLIAADANNSGNISAADLLELRKLILGVYDDLPNTDSWRFVDGMYQFPDPTNPWIGNFPEQCALDNMVQNTTVNFVAIKVGDVNGSASGHQVTQEALDSRSAFSLLLNDVKVVQGQTNRIPVMASDDAFIYGLQMMLNTRWTSDIRLVSGAVQVKDNDVHMVTNNKLGISIAIPSGIHVKAGDVLFYIETGSLQNGYASEMLSVNTTVRPEIYTDGLKEYALSLEWRKEVLEAFQVSGVQPNPWKAQTSIDVYMPQSSMIVFKVKDASGRKVVSRVEYLNKGDNRIILSSDELGTAGVYFFEIKYENTVHTGKMIMID